MLYQYVKLFHYITSTIKAGDYQFLIARKGSFMQPDKVGLNFCRSGQTIFFCYIRTRFYRKRERVQDFFVCFLSLK